MKILNKIKNISFKNFSFDKIKNYLFIGLAILAVILFIDACSARKKLRAKNDIVEGLSQEIETWKNKDGQSVTKIQALESDNAQAFLEIETADKEIQNLQAEVFRYKSQLKKGGSVTVIETITEIDTFFDVAVYYDTIRKDSFIYLNGTYTANIDNDWMKGGVIGRPENIQFKGLKIRNAYTVAIGSEKEGLFKKRKTFAEVTNMNPMSETATIRTYQVKSPRIKRIGIGPTFTAGYDVTNMFREGFSFKDEITYTVGLSVQWAILRL